MAVSNLMHEWRRPGCGQGCRELFAFMPGLSGRERLELHDPEAHEAWGAAHAEMAAAVGDEIVSGPLRISLVTDAVWVDGERVHLTATEWRILSLLARRAGGWVERYELVQTIWGDNDVSTLGLQRMRAPINRMRAKLGRAGRLIETWVGHGYGLRLLREGEQAPPPMPWSRQYERCRDCGTTAMAHCAQGYCEGCRNRRRRGGGRP